MAPFGRFLLISIPPNSGLTYNFGKATPTDKKIANKVRWFPTGSGLRPNLLLTHEGM